MAPPINFEASQLQQECLFWSNLHINLVTWVPTMTKAKQMFENVNSVRAMQVVGLNGLFSQKYVCFQIVLNACSILFLIHPSNGFRIILTYFQYCVHIIILLYLMQRTNVSENLYQIWVKIFGGVLSEIRHLSNIIYLQ